MQHYVNTMIQLNSVPLPIFSKVNGKGEFLLLNYTFSADLFMSMLVALPGMIPTNIVKMYLVNNSLSDDIHQDFYSSLKMSKGLKTLVISKNTIGPNTTESLVNFIYSDAVNELKKFVIKDPLNSYTDAQQIPKAINDEALKLTFLKKLILSKLGIASDGIVLLAHALKGLPSLHHLDVSNNLITSKSMTKFFIEIMLTNKLKSLNIAYNNLGEPYTFADSQGKSRSFDAIFSEFMNKSLSMLHLNMSGT